MTRKRGRKREMEKLERYRNLIKQQIRRYVDSFSEGANADVQEVAVLDDERGHYQWLSLVWENGKRAFYTHLFVRLHNGKIWIEKDTTEDGIATELVREGVPPEDIVLAFQPPTMRQYTDFAAA
jgi:XisI protein